MKRSMLLALFIILVISACSVSKTKNHKVINVDAAEFKEVLDKGDVFLLDTHIPEQQHIRGTDAFIPYNEIEQNADRLPEDKSVAIAVYCRSGSMSKIASEKLVERGYETVYNLVGGANAWRSRGYEFEV